MSTATQARPATGQPVVLATYTADSGERQLVGQRVDGVVRVTDVAASGHGRRFLVESQLETKVELDSLVADYLAKARRLGYPPMHGWF